MCNKTIAYSLVCFFILCCYFLFQTPYSSPCLTQIIADNITVFFNEDTIIDCNVNQNKHYKIIYIPCYEANCNISPNIQLLITINFYENKYNYSNYLVLRCPSWDSVEIKSPQLAGMSQDVPHEILRTSSQTHFAGCPRTVPGRPSWDPPDIQSTPLCRMSQDCPRTSLMGSSDIQSTPVCRMSQDCPRMSLMGSSRHPVNPSLQECPRTVPGHSHGILRISSQSQLAGCPRNVLGCPSWDPLDIKSSKDSCMSLL